MKCPYCMTELEATAIACPSCTRDLAFFMPTARRLSNAEERISAHASVIARLEDEKTFGCVDVAPIVALLSSGLLTFTFSWISWEPVVGNKFDWLFHFLSVAAPFLAAFGLGLTSRTLRPSAYWALGLVAGAVGVVELFVVYAICTMRNALSLNQPFLNPRFWWVSIIAYPIAGSFSFFSGGKLGRWVRRKAHPGDTTGEWVVEAWDDKTAKWLKITAPILSLIASVISTLVQHFWTRSTGISR
jgi:hypothetical protein